MPKPRQLLHDVRFQPVWRWLLALLIVVVAIFAFTPGDSAPSLGVSDKVDHVTAFAALAWTGVLAFDPAARTRLRLALALVGYGVVIELVQTQIPGRFAEFADVVADGVGITVGLAVAVGLRRLWPAPAP
jgi:VanZ family protein